MRYLFVQIFLSTGYLKAHQHFAVIEKTCLSRKFDQYMLKNALFFGKTGKIAAALGAPSPTPRWPPATGGSVPRSPSCCPITCYIVQISQCPKNYDLRTVLSHTCVSVGGPLSQACLPVSNL